MEAVSKGAANVAGRYKPAPPSTGSGQASIRAPRCSALLRVLDWRGLDAYKTGCWLLVVGR